MIDGVIQTGVQNPRHAVKPAGGGGMRMYTLSTVCGTHTGMGAEIGRDATSAMRDQGQRHLEAMCMTRGSQNASMH
jgi:hypothetical protein